MCHQAWSMRAVAEHLLAILMNSRRNRVSADRLVFNFIFLKFQAKTPEQWENSAKTVPKSPPCLGGSAR